MAKGFLLPLRRVLLLIALGSLVFHWVCDSFGFDEFHLTIGLMQNGLRSLDLSHPELHPVGAFLSWMAFLFFPPPQFSARLIGAVPGLLFSFVFIFQIAKAADRLWPRLGAVLVLLPLIVNPLFLGNSHSLKGYPIMLLTGLWLAMVPSIVEQKNRKLEIGLVILIALGPLIHSFVSIFSFASLLAQIFWGKSRRLLRMEMVAFLVSSTILLFHALVLFKREEIGMGAIGRHIPSTLVAEIFGLTRWYFSLLFLVFFGVLLFFRLRKKEGQKMSYLSWYLLSFVSVFGGLYVGLRPYILPGRFFLGVLPLLLLWAVEVMKAIEHSLSRRLVVGIFLLLFVLTPLYFNRSHLISHESSLIDRLEHFAHQVRQATKPVPQNCFEFQGVRNRVNLVRYLYLPGSQQEYFCPQRYRVVLGVGSREFPQFKDLTSYEEIFSDGEGNKLLRKINF